MNSLQGLGIVQEKPKKLRARLILQVLKEALLSSTGIVELSKGRFGIRAFRGQGISEEDRGKIDFMLTFHFQGTTLCSLLVRHALLISVPAGDYEATVATQNQRKQIALAVAELYGREIKMRGVSTDAIEMGTHVDSDSSAAIPAGHN